MDFKIVWADPAIDALREIVEHIAADNNTAASRLGFSLVEHMELAAHFPQMGPLYSSGSSGEIRCLTHGAYRLYYRIGRIPETIEVLSVRHTARQLPQF